MSLREYIEERCIPEPNTGCWLWLRSVGSHGYGNACLPGTRVTTAHRVSYLAFNGEIPDGMLIQHSCDNRICVNPDHLSLGTDKTNAEDKMRKGRGNHEGRVFPPHPTRKLTPGQVVSVRQSSESVAKIARRVSMDPAAIQRIRDGRHYRDISPETKPEPLPPLPAAVANDEQPSIAKIKESA